MKDKEMLKLRDILWEFSVIKRDVEEFNSYKCGVNIDGYLGEVVLVNGLEKIADYFGYEVEKTNLFNYLKLFDVTVMERTDETV